jgi:hypothetical protein
MAGRSERSTCESLKYKIDAPRFRAPYQQRTMSMKLSLFTTLCLSMALAACGQPVQEPGATVEATGEETVRPTPQQRAIALALEAVPEAEPYVDENGDFSLRDAVLDGGMTPEEARRLRADWAEAYADASDRVLRA